MGSSGESLGITMKLVKCLLALSLITIPAFGDNLYTWSIVALTGANTNFAVAGGLGAISIHNMGVKK